MAYLETDSPLNLGGNGTGFGSGEGWWIIILFALIFGWGRNGYGYGSGGSDGGVMNNYVLSSDFSNLERKIDGVNNGLCDGFYAQNSTMLNGFGQINSNIMTGTYETRLGLNTLGSQLADCCCKTQQNILATQNALSSQLAGLNYNLATESCAIKQNSDANTQRIIDLITTDKIATLQSENATLRARIDNAEQSNYIVGQLKPTPSPAYIVANPYCCNNSCGCGSIQ